NSGDMVSVPAGAFQMGCNTEVETQCPSPENPYHTVTLSAYKIDKYEVTAGDYQKCVSDGACNNGNVNEPHYQVYSQTYSMCTLEATGKENHPMNCVSWFGAKAYCEWMGKQLPTEAQWEKAARGTDGRNYPWGNDPSPNCDYAVIEDTGLGNGCGTNDTWAVGSKPLGVSPYGVFDMIGSVNEWTNDWYGKYYYESSPSENPAGPESGETRSIRGGSWSDYTDMRTSYRSERYPTAKSNYDGFRCVK
ncbi:MAG TPA: SUMF1/EgtB/PvdO family nonheme iron enzyme, partial [bacterium]|nr:SUMF1/EgtB/PvdO family nonheme iron enzyme [bacterium]